MSWCAGSSPRVRGTRRRCSAARCRRRFIPACAGNSVPRLNAADSSAVHPRVCGELAHGCGGNICKIGSSPRVRGTRRPSCPHLASTAVHPRVCGELSNEAAAGLAVVGSSPRVRGTRPPHRRVPLQPRFIPACAGNSAARRLGCPPRAVHPRVCGELQHGEHQLVCYRRFIPACAGNSAGLCRPCLSPAVHPRVCGELMAAVQASAQGGGSSPRVRGTRAPRRLASNAQSRFIPACAGNSLSQSRSLFLSPVHPRVCGELSVNQPPRRSRAGSSPRVRGTLVLRAGVGVP